MTKKKRSAAANAVMAALIVLILAAGVLGAGYLRGWFGDKDAAAVLTDARGIVNMTRGGVTYPVEGETPLRAGDVITCTPGGSAAVRIDGGSALAIGEQAVLSVKDAAPKRFDAELAGGELFAFVTGKGAAPVRIGFELGEIGIQDAVVSVSARTGAQTVDVFAGTAGGVAAGEEIYFTANGPAETAPIRIDTLNAFALTQLRAANTVTQTVFSNDELDALEARRKAEKEAASLAAMSEELSALDLACECTLEIRCDTILANYDKLETAKQEFVPDDGALLAAVKIPFAEGETAFDVTKRACEAYGLQLEYSWTPLYNSYYVEGIGHIYEFDCGSESGWMFKVNGWFPNYGPSSYVLADGDVVTWEYTCVGLGADLGGPVQ